MIPMAGKEGCHLDEGVFGVIVADSVSLTIASIEGELSEPL
jgi:hypothetical protein